MKKSSNKNSILTKLVITVIILIVCFFLYSLISFYIKRVRATLGKPIYSFDHSTAPYKDDYIIDHDISELYLSYGISYGIDVSEWQGKIDWEEVSKTGITFAMIRCGYRGVKGSNIYEDAEFKDNIEGAIKAGLYVGVYFFGTAKNSKEALEEANFVIDLIKGYKLSYPVVYDIETVNEGRLKGVNIEDVSNAVLTFTETIASYGYDTMIYSNKNTFTYKLYTGKFAGKLIWLAHYTEKTDYKGEYSMWQYTKEGKVSGIKGYVDLNVSYFKYVNEPDEIKNNPMVISTPYVSFEEIEEELKLKRNVYYRISPSIELPNIIGKLKKGTIIRRTGISQEISRIIYDGKTYYVSTPDLE